MFPQSVPSLLLRSYSFFLAQSDRSATREPFIRTLTLEKVELAAPVLVYFSMATRSLAAPASLAAGSPTARNRFESGLGRAPLPNALIRKYPNAHCESAWQWVFPASSHYADGGTGVRHRGHLHEPMVQKAVWDETRQVCVAKPATSHTFRLSFATHLLENGYEIRTVEELLGHKDVQTTMIFTHVLNRGVTGCAAPWIGSGRLLEARAGGLCVPTGRPNNLEAT
jgi:hypothetical protein